MYQTESERRDLLRTRLFIITVFIFILLFIGMITYHFLEGWSYKESLYFSAISLTTRGQTNLVPDHWISILFSVIYLLIGVAFIIYSISTLLGYYVAFYQESVERKATKILNRIKQKKDRKKPKWISWK